MGAAAVCPPGRAGRRRLPRLRWRWNEGRQRCGAPGRPLHGACLRRSHRLPGLSSGRRGAGPARPVRRRRRGRPSCRRPGCASSSRFRRLRSTASRACRTARSRSSTAARTGSTRSESPACGPGPGEAVEDDGVSAGLHPTETGDAVHRLLERVDLDAPVMPPHDELAGLVRSWYPTVGGSRARAHRGARPGLLRFGARAQDRGAARRAPGAAVRVRARRSARERASRRPVAERRSRTRARLQDERAARARPCRGRGRGVRHSAQRLCARLPPRRGRSGGDRVPVPRGAGRGGLDRVHTARCGDPGVGLVGVDHPDPGGRLSSDAEPVRGSGCPALDVVCAGPRLGGPSPVLDPPVGAAAE